MSLLSNLDPLEIIAKYYEPGSDCYRILVRHSTDVAEKALAIISHHPELSMDKDFVYQAAMLHDIGIFLTNAPTIHCYGSEPYIKHGILGAALLRELGLPCHALVCERHTASGLTREEVLHDHLPLPLDRSYEPESLEEKLICYADCFYSKTHLDNVKTVEQIATGMEKRWIKSGYSAPAATKQRFLAMHALFG